MGLCHECRKVPARKDRSLCSKCALRANERGRNRLNDRKAKGLCTYCGKNPASEGINFCSECSNKEAKRQAIKRGKNQSKGLCMSCGKISAIEGKVFCIKCANKANEKRKLRYAEAKKRVIEAYGGICACCGENHPSFLSIDHINNDGKEQRKEVVSDKDQMYGWLIKHNFPKDRFQLLCHNCNHGRHINGGVCPHQVQTKRLWMVKND